MVKVKRLTTAQLKSSASTYNILSILMMVAGFIVWIIAMIDFAYGYFYMGAIESVIAMVTYSVAIGFMNLEISAKTKLEIRNLIDEIMYDDYER